MQDGYNAQMPKFHLILWCENFVEIHSFRSVSGDETLGNWAFPQNFYSQELAEISVFYAALAF